MLGLKKNIEAFTGSVLEKEFFGGGILDSSPLIGLLPSRDRAILSSIVTPAQTVADMVVGPFVNGVQEITDTIREIMRLKFQLPEQVLDLLLQPILALGTLQPYQNILEPKVYQILSERRLLDSLARMAAGDVNKVISSLMMVREKVGIVTGDKKFAGVEGRLFFPHIMEKVDVMKEVKTDIKSMLFGPVIDGGIVHSLLPDALFELMYLVDIQADLGNKLNGIFNIDFEPHQIIDILDRFPLQGDPLLPIDGDILENPFLSKIGSVGEKIVRTTDAVITDTIAWKIGKFRPLTQVAAKVADLALQKSAFCVNLVTALPIFTIQTAINFVVKAGELTFDHINVKIGVLDIMMSLPFALIESLVNSVVMNPVWNLFDYADIALAPKDILINLPFQIEEFPGGFGHFKHIMMDMKSFLYSYKAYLLSLGMDMKTLPFGMFADFTRDLLANPPPIALPNNFEPEGFECIGDTCEAVRP